ncbi:MAG: flagellar export protein FliJ [Pseudomonadota bacterium]
MFQFKFKSVLTYRQQIEDVCQQEFAQSKNLWQKEKDKLEHYFALWKKCLDEWRVRQVDGVIILELELYQRYMLRLREEIRRQAEIVKECVRILDEKRAILLNAQKDKKMMEKLKEYHHEEYKAAELKKETKFLDEVATQRFNIKSRKQ